MSLEDLDRFLTLRDSDPDLAKALAQPMDLERFLALAADHGYGLSEADVVAAQQREHHARTAAQLQQDQAVESRRLRNFIHG
ncbi:bacteriocin [Synechococcus sp. KORDI-52]|uniref:Nif11-like leader peptide family natural product precursor n=1 Tax=Synechococcus sp. KORDI-52 TaxID=585425 RepID=UPI0004E05EAC|nr:Nif11-like leader peptide family natural product precursor [Synechococcus sp. KORDI-52]AII48811.1 bacteriocin [Synechococcus sp. KORDI-52]